MSDPAEHPPANQQDRAAELKAIKAERLRLDNHAWYLLVEIDALDRPPGPKTLAALAEVRVALLELETVEGDPQAMEAVEARIHQLMESARSIYDEETGSRRRLMTQAEYRRRADAALDRRFVQPIQQQLRKREGRCRNQTQRCGPRRRGAGRPRAKALSRSSSRSGDSGDSGSSEGDGDPPPPPAPLLLLVHSRFGRVNRALAHWLRGSG